MRRFLREPLLHFVVLGVLLFAADAWRREGGGGGGSGEILVSQGRIENLAALFAKTWQRPPDAQELRGLVDDYVLEEALYREGLSLGVDQDDMIIRRRVRQKVEFVVNDIVAIDDPTDAELEAWLAEHADSYARPARFTFRQVFLSADRRGDAVRSDAETVLAELRSDSAPADPRELGDRSLLKHAFADVGTNVVASTFGPSFADQLASLPTGEWSGPVESAFGLHVVFIDASNEGRRPVVDEVRAAVKRDWSYAHREEASKAFYAGVLEQYAVTVEWPE